MRLPEDRAVDEIYSKSKTFPALVVMATLGAFALAFLFNFPLGRNLTTFIEGQLAKNRACPLQYTQLEVGFFLPKIDFKNLKVPGRCFGNSKAKPLSFTHAQVKLSMPSIWPVGVKLKVEAYGKGIRLNLFPRLSFSGTDVQIEDSYIEGSFLKDQIPVILQGKIRIQANAELKNNKIVKGDIKAVSKNFFIPSQTVQLFNLKGINLQKFELAGSYVKKTFSIKALRLGKPDKALHAEFAGKVKMNTSNMALSTLDLDGRFKLSNDLLGQFGPLRFMLNGKKQKESYYYLKLNGTGNSVTPTFVDPP